MKAFIIIVAFLGMSITSFSQDKKVKNNEEGTMKAVELPEIVIKTAGKDFSFYLPDKHPDPNVKKLEDEFIAYNIGTDYEGYDSYLVVFEGKKGTLSATYNANGKLTGVVENYKNIQLPAPVIYSIYKSYPGWKIVNDKYLYSQEDGDIIKKEYNLKIKKDKETINLKVNPKGEIISKS